MNVQLYEPDIEWQYVNYSNDDKPVAFMRVSNFGSYVKLEDYEGTEKAYESLLVEQSKLEDDLQEAEEASGYWENLYYEAKHQLDNIVNGECD